VPGYKVTRSYSLVLNVTKWEIAHATVQANALLKKALWQCLLILRAATPEL
jgi:hypothetical protein